MPGYLCDGKRRYQSNTAALRVATARAGKTTRNLRVYLCPKCNAWHLTKLIPTSATPPHKPLIRRLL